MSCFQVWFNWSKYLGCIGENGIEIGLRNKFLRAKMRKRVFAELVQGTTVRLSRTQIFCTFSIPNIYQWFTNT